MRYIFANIKISEQFSKISIYNKGFQFHEDVTILLHK